MPIQSAAALPWPFRLGLALLAADAKLATTLPAKTADGRTSPLAGDHDFWIRRAALLALLGPLRRGEGDFERFARYADAMLEDREFFVRKAIGWVLRETARKQPSLVCTWLLPRAARASGVTIREAIKPLSEQQRAAVLAAR